MKPKKKNIKKIRSLSQWTENRKNNPDYMAAGLMVQVTEEISKVLSEKNWTRSHLAKKMKCSEAYVTKLLRGEENLTIKKIAQVASVLSLTPKIALDGGSHEMITTQQDYTVREIQGPLVTIFTGKSLFATDTISKMETMTSVTVSRVFNMTQDLALLYGSVGHA